MSVSLRITAIKALAPVLTAAALFHAYFFTPLLFWPLVALLISTTALTAHSPMAVARRMTFLAHAQSHTVLTAALLAALAVGILGVSLASPVYVVLVLLLVAVLNLSVLAAVRLGFREDVATGVVMSLQLSAAVALLTVLRSFFPTVDPLAVITGEYIFVSMGDVVALAPFVATSLLFPLFFHMRYLYVALDEHYARALGMRVGLYDLFFLFSMSTAVAGGVYTLGALIPSVLLVVPGAAASRHSDRLTDQLPLSISIGLSSGAIAHFLYATAPWLWPNAALGAALVLFLLAKK
ncbi:MAG: metal ABC transporter permease [Pyrobaculum sp.]